jgi:hypothetical protein
MNREGNLQAPTRHPIDWKGADYYDEAACEKEMERVFDICHGCRRCVSLCQSFPTLFDLVDATADGEVHGVDKKDFGKVVDQCYLCDLCYMTKCPYVPPHQRPGSRLRGDDGFPTLAPSPQPLAPSPQPLAPSP